MKVWHNKGGNYTLIFIRPCFTAHSSCIQPHIQSAFKKTKDQNELLAVTNSCILDASCCFFDLIVRTTWSSIQIPTCLHAVSCLHFKGFFMHSENALMGLLCLPQTEDMNGRTEISPKTRLHEASFLLEHITKWWASLQISLPTAGKSWPIVLDVTVTDLN